MNARLQSANAKDRARAAGLLNVPRTVLVVPAGQEEEPVGGDVRDLVPASCVSLDGDSAVTILRTQPFAVTAVVLSGDGESPLTASVLQAIKQVAPRVPIVFLDEKESVDSEMTIRRAGVHYYSHLPANSEEIAAVLAHLADTPGTTAGAFVTALS